MTDLRFQLRALVEAAAVDELPDMLADLESAAARGRLRIMTARVDPRPAANDQLVNAAEMARRLSLPEHWVRDHARRRLIPSIKVGHYVVFDPAAVVAAVKALNGANVSNRIAHPVRAEKRNSDKESVH